MKTRRVWFFIIGLVLACLPISEGVNASADSDRAIPAANKVTLSATPNIMSKAGCPMTAWVGYVDTQGNKSPLKNYTVNFVKVSGNGAAPAPGVSDANGQVKRTIPWNTVVKATVQSNQLLTSNTFSCGASNSPN